MRHTPRAVLGAVTAITLVAASLLVAGAPAAASGHHHPYPPAPQARVGFASAHYEELAGYTETVTIALNRPLSRTTSVRVTSRGGSAVPGVDYEPVNERVIFPAGETTATVDVRTTMRGFDVPEVNVVLRLSNPSRGLKLGYPKRTSVTIIPFEIPPLDQGTTTALETFENGVPAGYSGWATGGATAPTLSTVSAPDYYNEADNDALQVAVATDPAAGERIGFESVQPAEDLSEWDGFTIAFRGTGSGRVFSYSLSNGSLEFEHQVVDQYVGWAVYPVRFSDLRLADDPSSPVRYDKTAFTGFSVDVTGLGAGNWLFEEPAKFQEGLD